MIGSNFLRYQREQVFVALDFETEGLNLYNSRPYQLGYIKFTLNRILAERNLYIWHDNLKMSEEAARVTRFNYEHYKSQARPAAEVMTELKGVLEDPSHIIVWHNGLGFDSMVANTLARETNIPLDNSYLCHCIDTLALARLFRLGIKSPSIRTLDDLLALQYRMIDAGNLSEVKKLKCSLGALNKEFKLGFDDKNLHDGLEDCKLMIEVFKKLILEVEI
jgi:DNA polymerase III epsilon subunit-like protein